MKIFTFIRENDNDDIDVSVHLTEKDAYQKLIELMPDPTTLEDDTAAVKLFHEAIGAEDFSVLHDYLIERVFNERNGDRFNIESHELQVPPVLVTISGGMGDVAENPSGLDVQIIDFDCIRRDIDSGSGKAFYLGTAAIDYLKRECPDFYAGIEPDVIDSDKE